jgi:hypothetical protein
MATALLKFDLTNQDDLQEFRRMTSSLDMAMILWEILHNSRKKIIGSIEAIEIDELSIPTEVYDEIDNLYKSFWELCEQHNVYIDNLIS